MNEPNHLEELEAAWEYRPVWVKSQQEITRLRAQRDRLRGAIRELDRDLSHEYGCAPDSDELIEDNWQALRDGDMTDEGEQHD